METKPAVQSGVLWGLFTMAVPYLIEGITYVTALPPGTVPHPVILGLSATGWVLALYSRIYGTNKPISGILKSKE
jgi:hypothetical protein